MRSSKNLEKSYSTRDNSDDNRTDCDSISDLSKAVALQREAVALCRKRVAFSCTLFGIQLAIFALQLIFALLFN